MQHLHYNLKLLSVSLVNSNQSYCMYHSIVLATVYRIVSLVMSCEPKRTSPYSQDLRWRMVYHNEMEEKSCREVGDCLAVDPSTVSRTVALFYESGKVDKRKHPPNRGTAKLTEIDKIIILETVIERPEVYLHEIQQILVTETGTSVCISTISRFLQTSNITRQKMVMVAKQQSELLRAEYLLEMKIFLGHPELLIFVDEIGADRRNCLRRFGYSIRGTPATFRKMLVRGQRVSAIAAISITGVLDCYTVTGSVDAEKFADFVEEALLPHLQPFNGVNPHSVVIMDNASIHHAHGIVDLIESTGALVIFLPPCSPDLNPIEEAFSKVKSTLKANETLLNTLDVESLVLHACTSFTTDDCKNWISHAGYC